MFVVFFFSFFFDSILEANIIINELGDFCVIILFLDRILEANIIYKNWTILRD